MDISYKGTWGYHALVVSLANTGEVLSTVNRSDNTRRATASQVRALHAIAERQGINLAGILSGRYSLTDPAALSITEASQLTDQLKKQASGNGSGGRR